MPMDIDLLKTFLEVERVRHFGRASERLYITQSAVSARIRQLEELLGVELFTRKRNDIQLTPAGRRLKQHAAAIINQWERARQETGLGEAFRDALAIGGLADLWPTALENWLVHLQQALPDIALRGEAGAADELVHRLLNGALDIACVYDPPQASEFTVRSLGVMELVLVATGTGMTAAEAMAENYILVDWGTAFALSHAHHFPDLPAPAVHLGQGLLARDLLLRRPGAAYLPRQWLETDPRCAGRLHGVADAPVLERSWYALWREGTARQPLLEAAIENFPTPG